MCVCVNAAGAGGGEESPGYAGIVVGAKLEEALAVGRNRTTDAGGVEECVKMRKRIPKFIDQVGRYIFGE